MFKLKLTYHWNLALTSKSGSSKLLTLASGIDRISIILLTGVLINKVQLNNFNIFINRASELE